MDLEIYQDSTIAKFRFLQKKVGGADRFGPAQNARNIQQYSIVSQNMFDLVGVAHVFKIRDSQNVYSFNFQLSKKYQESTLPDSCFPKIVREADRFIPMQNSKIFIERVIHVQRYV